MRIIESKIESLKDGRFRLTTVFGSDKPRLELGAGPTDMSVVDKIVRLLVASWRSWEGDGAPSLPISHIKQAVGGNPGTVNRQARALAKNLPELKKALRGWVISPERGHYALSPAAQDFLTAEGRGKA